MKRILTLTALTGLLAAQQCFALTVVSGRYAGYSTEPGGEFTITSLNPDPAFNAIYNNYASVATLNGGFETFCISTAIDLQGNPQSAILDPNGVSVGAAWLYSQFAHGVLAGYDYTPGAGRAASAMALQGAIWTLQQQTIGGYWSGFDPSTDPYVLAAIAQFGSLANAEALGVSAYGVDALRLTYTDPNGAQITSQPMLALVPDGGTTMMLLGMGLSAMGLIRRRVIA
jgi:hypothetical protein